MPEEALQMIVDRIGTDSQVLEVRLRTEGVRRLKIRFPRRYL